MKQFVIIFLLSFQILVNTVNGNDERAKKFGAKFRRNKSPVKNEYIVVFKEKTRSLDIQRVVDSLTETDPSTKVIHKYDIIPGFFATLNNESLDKVLSHPKVQYVEENGIVTALQSCSTQAVNGAQPGWALSRITNYKTSNGPFTYPNTGGSGIFVYIIDTGVNVNHPDVKGRVLPGPMNLNSDQTNVDNNGHGTAVASNILGTQCGVAKKATGEAVKVLNSQGSGSNANVISGVEYAVNNCKGRKCVINMSLGGGKSASTNAAVERASNSGILVVVAAGNERQDACNVSPASSPLVLTAGATDTNNNFATSFSNYGKCVKVLAPGANVRAADAKSNGYLFISGTSFSSPFTAGVASVIWGSNLSFTASQVKTAVINNAANGVITAVPASTPNKLIQQRCP